MNVASSPPSTGRLPARRSSLFWRVFALDAGLLILAGLILAFSPVTISAPIEQAQAVVLTIGVIVFVIANGLLLWLTLRPLRELSALMNTVDLREPGRRLEIEGSGEVSEVIRTFNRTLTRLEDERRESSTIAFRAQEAERRRIARELHDEIGQNLTGMLLFLKRAEETEGSERDEALRAAQDTARVALEELRRVDGLLRPSVLADLGLPAALHALAETFEARTATRVDVDVDETVELEEGVALTVYRIAQEALTNAARHADSTHVDLSLHQTGEGCMIELMVSDNGVGIGDESFGGGLRGMRERALIIHGVLRVESRPGSGTQIVMTAPVDAGGEPLRVQP